MKTILKLVVTAVALIACFNGGRAMFTDYQFEDAVHQQLIFNPRASDAQLMEMVTTVAAEHNVPIDPKEGVAIRRQDPNVHIDLSYTTTIVLVPGVFSRDWTFSKTVSTRILPGVGR
jgi:hypothetical protein